MGQRRKKKILPQCERWEALKKIFFYFAILCRLYNVKMCKNITLFKIGGRQSQVGEAKYVKGFLYYYTFLVPDHYPYLLSFKSWKLFYSPQKFN